MPNNILQPQRLYKKRKSRRTGGSAKRKMSNIMSNKTITQIMAPMTYIDVIGLGANTAQMTDGVYINSCIDSSAGFYGMAGIPYGRYATATPLHQNRRPMNSSYAITDRKPDSTIGTVQSVEAWRDLLERGYLKSLDWTAGRQYWFESFALPVGRMFHPDNSVHTAIHLHHAYPCFNNLVSLMHKAAARMKDQKTYDDTLEPIADSRWPTSTLMGDNFASAIDSVNNEGGTPNTSNALPWIEKTLYQCNFKYHGGKQIHTFTNTLNINSYGTFYELIPKLPLTDFNVTNSLLDPQQPLKIWALVKKDLQYLANLTEKGLPWSQFGPEQPHPPTYEGDFTHYPVNQDEPSDPDFIWSKKCPILNHYFKIVKVSSAVIAPGNTYTYTMSINPFYLTLTNFRQTLLQFYNNDEASLNNRQISSMQPNYFPGFSKFLVARFKSARVHGTHNPFVFGVPSNAIDDDPHFNLHSVDASDSTTVQQPNPGAEINSDQTEGMPSGIPRIVPSSYKTHSIGPGCLTHTMREIHSCQSMPVIPLALKTRKNLSDGATSYWDIPNTEAVGMVQYDGDNNEVDMTVNIVDPS